MQQVRNGDNAHDRGPPSIVEIASVMKSEARPQRSLLHVAPANLTKPGCGERVLADRLKGPLRQNPMIVIEDQAPAGHDCFDAGASITVIPTSCCH